MSRLQLERIFTIDRKIRDGQFPNAEGLAAELEVSRRVIFNDRKFLLERLGAPLRLDRTRGGWYYSEPTWVLPAVMVTQGELLAFFLSVEIARRNLGGALEASLLGAVEKIARTLPGAVEIDLEGLRAHFSFAAFSFASAIESDKRDAADNKRFRRDEQLVWAGNHFSFSLQSTLKGLKPRDDLDIVRTQIRDEAVKSLQDKLKSDERVWTLTAPTGAGKTYTLLALADEIRRGREHLGVAYGLPFLSIAEQVEGICRDIWPEEDFISRIDSRAQNPRLDELIEQANTDPLAATELVKEHFSFETFDGAFIITTFVQIFETLLSNRNATLLKLPNFTKTIFLLDEFQALPPRLYIFFVAYLRAWCEKFDCYTILSTATMPHLEMTSSLPEGHSHHPNRLFPDYQEPTELLDYSKYFSEAVFNRYRISSRGELTLMQLACELENEEQSCLVILNTIADTKDLFDELTRQRNLTDTKVVLLNTHFTLDDRRRKIADCKKYLGDKQRVILVSTQLIEAGVDIDFPVVFRDLCPLPNLIQSAGRCNRNNKLPRGEVVFFTLIEEEKGPRAHLIYRHPSDRNLLEQTREVLEKPYEESQLLGMQREFFKRMAHNFAIGDHPLRVNDKRDEKANLIEYVADYNFPVVGSFRLIDEKLGEEFRLYVPEDENDDRWNVLAGIITKIAKAHEQKAPASTMRTLSIKLDGQLRTMSGRIVTVRCKKQSLPPLKRKHNQEDWELCSLFCLENWDFDYSPDTGIKLQGLGAAIL